MRGSSRRKLPFYRLNLPLVLGGALTGLLVALALFGPMWAPYDPLETHFMMPDRNGELKMAPFEPGQLPEFPLGSDWDGRDILSRLIWAVRPTLILATLVATCRLVGGTVLGFLGGWYGGVIGDLITSVTRVALGIPIIILAIVVIYILGFRFEAWIFIIALTLTGWANTAKIMSERAHVIRGEPFIEASRAVGARDRRLLWRHVLPQVRTLLLVTWAFEMSAVLLQLAELGFLGFFMGGGAIRLIPDPESGGFISQLKAGSPELSQMLSAGWENFFMVPWMSVVAGTAFFFAVFSFMMLSEGLKRYYVETSRAGSAAIRFKWVSELADGLARHGKRRRLDGQVAGVSASPGASTGLEIVERVFGEFLAVDKTAPNWLMEPGTDRRPVVDRLYPELGLVIQFQDSPAESQWTGAISDGELGDLCRQAGFALVTVNAHSDVSAQTLVKMGAALSAAARRVSQRPVAREAKLDLVPRIASAKATCQRLLEAVIETSTPSRQHVSRR